MVASGVILWIVASVVVSLAVGQFIEAGKGPRT
jgi:hypothetical protein